ncbi:hypothetical protein KJ953_03555 [Patescibacteria group bacterium]|nr:hypothetical protein [Patescibacteria group bacterium]MBU1256604.1 hypothetical protein [Patescibacteria group bacterium]MBU1457512.1 hypothetical protein [Patescibacteria group bacterium]
MDKDEEIVEVEPNKKWIGRRLKDMSKELLALNPVPEVRWVVGGKNDDRKTRVVPGELAVSKEHKVPAEMVKFARKRYGDDVVIYMKDGFYLIKLFEDDGSKQGRPVGIAEIGVRDGAWYVRESRVARNRWKELYQELFVAQYGGKALDEFLNRG